MSFTRQKELVTFVIPTLGRSTLSRALYSLQRQSSDSWKCIVVFDGPDARQNYDEKDHQFESRKITFLTLPQRVKDANPRANAGSVRNFAFSDVDTEWIAFLDDDDTVSPYYVATLAEQTAKNPETTIFSFQVCFASNKVKPEKRFIDLQMVQNGQMPISFAVKTASMRESGIRFEARNAEDFAFVKAFEKKGYKVTLVEQIMYFTRAVPLPPSLSFTRSTKEETAKNAYFLARENLKHWLALESFNKVKLVQTDLQRGQAMLRITNEDVKVVLSQAEQLSHRVGVVVNFIRRAIAGVEEKIDFHVVVDVRDCPAHNVDNSYPILAQGQRTNVRNHDGIVLLPLLHMMIPNLLPAMLADVGACDKPFLEKNFERAVFCGAASGNCDESRNYRAQFANFESTQNAVDFSLTTDRFDGLQHVLKPKKSLASQVEYAFQLCIPGNAGPDSRFQWQLKCNSLAFLYPSLTQDIQIKEWNSSRLVADKHYVEVRRPQEMEQLVPYYRENRERASQIIKNAHEFHKTFGTEEFALEYTANIVLMLQQLFLYQRKSEDNML